MMGKKLVTTVDANRLTPKQALFLDWLTSPSHLRSPSTQAQWAVENGVGHRTAASWRSNPEFRKAWDRRLTELQIDPERVDEVMQAIHTRAATGDTKAAAMYLEVVDRFRPPAEPDPREMRVELVDLSDAELESIVAGHAAAELLLRRDEAASDDAGDVGA